MNDALSPNLRLIGRYAVLRELRRDRSSVTYIGMDPVMHREVVLKAVQLPAPATIPDSNESQIAPLEAAFVRQAQAAGKLHHPHIVTVFDAGRVHNVAYLAIERVAGRSLAELLAGGWRPEFVHCASIAARVADAIEHAHANGLAHGHLGPQHVLLQGDGAPKVEGFGGWIDSGSAGEDALVRTEKLLPYFQNELTEEARHRDVRAVAAVLHMMLTGKAPQLNREPQAVRSVLDLRPDTPPELARIVDDTLAIEHPAGHRTAGDLRDALTAFLWNERKEHVPPGTIGIPLAAPPRAPDDFDLQASQFNALRPATRPGTRPATRPAFAAPAADKAPATRQVIQPVATLGGAAVAPPVPREPTAEPQAIEEPAPPIQEAEPSLAVAGSEFGQLAWRRSREWVRGHRTAVAAVGGLIAVGVLLGVVLAQFAGRPGGAGLAAALPPPAMKGPAAAQAPAGPAAQGIVTFEIAPWGEILVDNKPAGVAPPLAELKLSSGRHTIEIRHGDLPAVAATVDVDPAKPLRIRHRFQ
jgi:eukaryotic-like serine/threonine-protein kinase